MADRENLIILGANSGIARALARLLAGRGHRLVLAARHPATIADLADELRNSGSPGVACEAFDALDTVSHAGFVERCLAHCSGGVDGVILCYGYLPPQPNELSPDEVRLTIDANFTSAAMLLERFAIPLVSRHRGYMAVVTSVAGDRGRQSNYPYGAAKGGMSHYLEGLRNRLFPQGVHVLTVKPGFVDTPMIAGRVNTSSPLVARPDRVARDILRAIDRRRNVIYTPWFWRPIMAIVTSIPEAIFKRLKV